MVVAERRFEGIFFDGVTPGRVAVNVCATAPGLVIEGAGDTPLLWPWEEVTQTQGHLQGEPLRLEHGPTPSQAVVVADAELAAVAISASPSAARCLALPRRGTARIVALAAAALASVALVGAAYVWGVPALARTVAERLPPRWEAELGERALASYGAFWEVCDDATATEALAALVTRLTAAVPGQPYEFRVQIARVDAVNAVAFPGGHLVVFSGLLAALDEPAEVAGVLAHEVQHVLRRHGTESLVRELSVGVLLAAALGDADALASAFDVGRRLGAMRYSRMAEAEADRLGMELLMRARIDPQGMIRAFEKLDSEAVEVPAALYVLADHPATEVRVATLRELAAEYDGPVEPLVSTEVFRSALAPCLPEPDE